ncbi:putative methyltransferase-domain-containing protein, partial [Kalaharituber pfeilii]
IVFDLPQLYTRPSAPLLLTILAAVRVTPVSWDPARARLYKPSTKGVQSRYASLASSPGLSKWLTSIVASSLKWIEDEDEKEKVWEEAGRRLAERCGRTAMPAVTREFRIPLAKGEGIDHVTITLHEPSLTADNLGFKTWGSAYLLAKRLSELKLPPGQRALELGSGTGLAGIACAAVMAAKVTLTDLPEIVPNLQRNVDINSPRLNMMGSGSMDVQVLDWTDPPIPSGEEDKYPLILAADPLYSAAHPGLLVGVLRLYVMKDEEARAVVEFPLREGFNKEREEFWSRMKEEGFVLVEGGVEEGYDDWGVGAKVRCWWGVYKWGERAL